MKIGILGDLHLRSTRPKFRCDNFKETMDDKLHQIMEQVHSSKVDIIVQPGDFFDTVRVPYSIIAEMMGIISTYQIPWYVVFGQHDLRFHNLDTSNTPLQVLIKSKYVKLLSPSSPQIIDDVKLWGKSWGESLPSCEVEDNYTHVLVAHHMVIDKSKVWEGQKDYDTAKNILRNYKFDLSVFGDNHNSFLRSVRDRHVVNCGSLFRSSISQRDHHPNICIYNSRTGRIDRKYLQVKPFSQVMDLERASEEEIIKKRSSSFVLNLKKSFEGNIDFRSNLQYALEETKLKKNVVRIIQNSLPDGG